MEQHNILKRSLLLKFLLIIVFVILLIVFLFGIYFYLDERSKELKQFNTNIENLKERFCINISSSLWSYMLDDVENSILVEMKDTNIYSILVFSNIGDLFSGKIRDNGNIIDYEELHQTKLEKGNFKIEKIDVINGDSKVGEAHFYFSTLSSRKRLNSILIKVILQNLILFFVVSTVIYIVFNGLIINNLKVISKQVEKIASGDADLTKKIEVKTFDEMGQLSIHINNFISKINLIISKIKKISHTAKNISGELSHQTNTSTNNLSTINNFMSIISEKIKTLNTEISNSDDALKEIYKVIDDMNKLVTDQSSHITESSASIEEMVASMNTITNVAEEKKFFSDKLGELAKDGELKMKETFESMNDIEKSAGVMFDMIKVINNVAGQTNLLAMNASIEAAHAGEYGKGFAVVADEIRNLAETTAVNSKNISSTLKEVIDKIQRSVSVTKSTSDSITEILNGIYNFGDSMSEMLLSLQEITMGSKEVTTSLSIIIQITNEVLSFSKTISKKASVIEKTMGKVIELSDEHNLSIDEMNSGIKLISDSLSVVHDLSEKNSGSMNIIDDEISKFITGNI